MLKEFLEVLRKSRLAKLGLVLAIIGLTAFFFGLLSPLNKGVPFAPGRIVLAYIFNLFYAGLIIMLWAYFKDHKTWLVPWYEEGQKIELFSSQRVVRIALIAAATIVFAFVKIPFLGWSIRTVAPAFGAMYFGLLEGLVGGWVGYMLSTLIVGGYSDPLATIPLWMSSDAVVISLFSVLYFRFIRNESSAATRSKRYFLMLLVSFVIWYILIVTESIGTQGAAVVLPNAFLYLMGGLIILAIITLIAVGAVEAMNRTRWAKTARTQQKK